MSSRFKSGVNKTKKGIKRVTPSKETLYKAASAANTAYDIADQTGLIPQDYSANIQLARQAHRDASDLANQGRHLYRNTSEVYNAYPRGTQVRGGKRRRTTKRRKSRKGKSRRSKRRNTTRRRKSRKSKKRRTTRSRKSKSNGDMKYVQIPKNLLTF